MNNPLISVVMSVYNGEKYLAEAIESILNQTYKNFEFIIVNDGSKDNSVEIIKNYMKQDNRIVLIDRENKGLPYSLNEGISIAKGEYIARMDADDISLPTRFEKQIKYFEDNIEIGICGTFAETFGTNTKSILLKQPLKHDEMKICLLFSVCFAHPTVMMKKEVLEKNKLKYNNNYPNAQDYELWSKISNTTKMGNISEILLRYRISKNSITSIADGNKTELRYKLISDIFKIYIKSLGLNNTEEENKLHFTLALNTRIQNSKYDIEFVNNYLQKLIIANRHVKLFDESKLIVFLSKKFLVFSYYKFKKSYLDIRFLKYKLFYIGIFERLKS